MHAAGNAQLQRLVQKHGRRVGAARFVAGETLDECVAVLRKLNDSGLHANTTLLGEAIPDADGAAAVTDEYERILERLITEKLRAKIPRFGRWWSSRGTSPMHSRCVRPKLRTPGRGQAEVRP